MIFTRVHPCFNDVPVPYLYNSFLFTLNIVCRFHFLIFFTVGLLRLCIFYFSCLVSDETHIFSCLVSDETHIFSCLVSDETHIFYPDLFVACEQFNCYAQTSIYFFINILLMVIYIPANEICFLHRQLFILCVVVPVSLLTIIYFLQKHTLFNLPFSYFVKKQKTANV